jgi:hypothetical protein
MEADKRTERRENGNVFKITGLLAFEICTAKSSAARLHDAVLHASIRTADIGSPWKSDEERPGQYEPVREFILSPSTVIETGTGCIHVVSIRHKVSFAQESIRAYQRYLDNLARVIALSRIPQLDRVYSSMVITTPYLGFVSESAQQIQDSIMSEGISHSVRRCAFV